MTRDMPRVWAYTERMAVPQQQSSAQQSSPQRSGDREGAPEDEPDRTRDADLDLRLVRYFTVVAEYLHFGCAASALRVAQPSLSRQIRRLEQQLGARLFDRTTQGTKLTEAGEVFLPQAKALLKSASRATASTRAAAEPSRMLVGYITGIFVTPAVRELRRQNPDADVRAVHLDWNDAREALVSHRVDVVVARMPFRTELLHVTMLYDEPRGVILPVGHRLAGKEFVTLDDIADEPLPRVRGADPAWSAFWRAEPRPDGRRAPDGPIVDALEDKFEVIAAGDAIAITAVPNGHQMMRADLTIVPLEGVEPCHVVLAARAGERNRLVSGFRKIAMSLLTGPEPVPA